MVCWALAPSVASEHTVDTVRREIHPARVVMLFLRYQKDCLNGGARNRALNRACNAACNRAFEPLCTSLRRSRRADPGHARRDVPPCRLAARELLTQVRHEFG